MREVVAQVQMVLTADGQFQVQFSGPGDVVILGMLEKAKPMIAAKFASAAASPVAVAPAGLDLSRLGRG